MKYFGTDGFRGRVNETLTVDHAIKIGKFLGYYFSNTLGHVRCVIGKDTRKSGYMYEYGLVAGLTSTGVDVSLLHVTTTPSISYITRTEKFDFGIMITASHNPYYDNGIKVIDRDGFKMSDKILELVEADEALSKSYQHLDSVKGLGIVNITALIVYTNNYSNIFFNTNRSITGKIKVDN